MGGLGFRLVEGAGEREQVDTLLDERAPRERDDACREAQEEEGARLGAARE